jgi:hypothetical protein
MGDDRIHSPCRICFCLLFKEKEKGRRLKGFREKPSHHMIK